MIGRGMRSSLVLAVLVWSGARASAQATGGGASPSDSTRAFLLEGVNVTATRESRPVFSTPVPVTVIDGARLRASGAPGAADALLGAPGLDAEGVGPAQRRPVVRGMRGQRVLLLEDGLRLNNARRRVDSGEPTALVPLGDVERVEVVRGPASVLYGSDALGGVVNLVPRTPPWGSGESSGRLIVGHREAGSSSSAHGEWAGAFGGLALRLSGGVRDAEPYQAPAGTFGAVTLPEPATVHDTGGRERTVRAEAAYRFAPDRSVSVRSHVYRSSDSGFGWLDVPSVQEGGVRTRLWWPEQEFERTTASAHLGRLGLPFADRLDVSAFVQDNRRRFLTEISAPLQGGAGGSLDVHSANRTDLDSRGLRIEAHRLVVAPVLLTWGLDLHQEHSTGTDSSRTSLSGTGPAIVTAVRTRPQVPDARLRNLGVFGQARVELGARTHVVVGARYQSVRVRTLATQGNDHPPVTREDRTLVGALSAVRQVGDALALVGSVARGFRSPNLVERFYTGFTGDNRGYWVENPDLRPETSLDVELGGRLRTSRLRAEAFVFRNALRDGIVLEPTGNTVGRARVYRNVNVERLHYRGLELALEAGPWRGLRVEGHGTVLEIEDARDPDRILAESYSDKLGLAVRWDDPAGRFTARYGIRRNGARDVPEGTSPVGSRIPAFVVHDARASARLFGRSRVVLSVQNLTDVLYAEALNLGIFRPEPGRNVSVSWEVTF